MKKILQSIGPAIIVAAVVLGPGSILTSSKVGATFGGMGVPVVIGAALLMIGMVALSARVGVIYEGSACDELAGRLGRPVAAAIGIILFLVAALFQSSNNIAVVAGLLPLVELMTGGEMAQASAEGERSIPIGGQVTILVIFNAFVIACLYLMRNLYRSIEKLMKILIGVMVLAFLFNFVAALLSAPDFESVESAGKGDLFALLGMIGTTFSVAGAFYQSYLVKEKGWGIGDAKRGLVDSVVSISVLGLVTIVVLLTAARTFYGRQEPIALAGVDDVARQLEPLFGTWAVVIFSVGIIAGAFSSFLVNSMIGGTVMSDGLGKGSRLSENGPIHMTTLALLVGMTVAIFSLTESGSTVTLITIAQALTVLGIPALAAALLFLGTRPELTGPRKVPRWILALGGIGFLVACALAVKTATAVWDKVQG